MCVGRHGHVEIASSRVGQFSHFSVTDINDRPDSKWLEFSIIRINRFFPWAYTEDRSASPLLVRLFLSLSVAVYVCLIIAISLSHPLLPQLRLSWQRCRCISFLLCLFLSLYFYLSVSPPLLLCLSVSFSAQCLTLPASACLYLFVSVSLLFLCCRRCAIKEASRGPSS